MMAEGYKTQPLSDELERRIRERLAQYRRESTNARQNGRLYDASGKDGAIAALNFVLDQADALKLENPRAPIPFPALATCPDCGHIHADDAECGFPIGGGRKCRCERKVRA